jgi:hypothetical protein
MLADYALSLTGSTTNLYLKQCEINIKEFDAEIKDT